MSSPLPRVEPTARQSLARRGYIAFLRTRVGRWTAINVAPKADPWLLAATKGRVGMGLMLPSALLTTTGAKSGLPRTNAVLYFHDGDDVVVIASSYGRDQHPAWYHNLKANPDVVIGGQPMVAAEVADEGERARLWGLADQVYPLFADYRARAAEVGRTIPVIRLRRG